MTRVADMRLSATLDCQIIVVPDGFGTCSDGANIYLEKRYHSKVSSILTTKRIGIKLWPKSQAIYFLLHEHGHVLQTRRGDAYEGVKSELDANVHAAAFFRNYCSGKLGLKPKQVARLWAALPSYYRKPTNV